MSGISAWKWISRHAPADRTVAADGVVTHLSHLPRFQHRHSGRIVIHRCQGVTIVRIVTARLYRVCLHGQRGSAAVEYVGLALVISMLMAAVGSAVDSALGERLAHALVERLVGAVSGN